MPACHVLRPQEEEEERRRRRRTLTVQVPCRGRRSPHTGCGHIGTVQGLVLLLLKHPVKLPLRA